MKREDALYYKNLIMLGNWDEYYSMTKDGIITLEEFDFAFSRFLDTGVLSNVDFNLQKPTLLDKIKSIFKKMI